MSRQVKALFEFWGESDAELSFQVGDVISVIKQDDAGWWEGELHGRRGLFPSNYVEAVATAPPNRPPNHASPPPAPVATINRSPPPNPLAASVSPVTQRAGPPPVQAAGPSRAPPAPTGDGPLKANPAFGMGQVHSLPANTPATFNPTAAASSAAGERKPAGQVRGGGGDAATEKKVVRVSKTKFGLWSSNMAWWTGCVMVPMGLLSILWHGVDARNHEFQYVLSGAYSVIAGIGIMWWESNVGTRRGETRIPIRALVYFGLSIYMFFALATVFCGAFLLAVSILNFFAALLKEVYDTPPPSAAKETADLVKVDSFCEGLFAWATMIRQQNKVGTLVFMSVYFGSNMLLFGYTVNWWTLKNASLPAAKRLSDWGPWAKGFGALLDLNCAIIVLPVSRTLLRMLYNRSTADQGTVSRTLRAILRFIPLDQNIAFHKMIAWVILFSACGHVTLHHVNLAFAYDNTLALFGRSAWVTGGIILFFMMILYSATPENTRRGQFEIFWYSHHVFVLFFVFILFHGNNGINPNYWKYAIPTMAIYILERLLRVYRASLPVSILSVTIMDDVLSLEFAKEGVFESGYQEGQYMFLQSAPLSRIQWHPFTISSAPQESSVTVHIRVMGEGSWTRGLMQYMSTMCPKGKSYTAFDRMGPSGQKIPGKILGPDGRPIIRIDGPHSAPTQHVGEYSAVMVIGAGIGATPVSSTLKSVVFHKWRVNLGECFPAHASFMWVCAHRDIDAFRWLLRTIKEAQDEVVHMRANNAAQMATKTFEVHIFLTSAPKNPKPVEVVIDDEIGFWGPPREATRLDKIHAAWDEIDLYKAMKCPVGHQQLGDVHIWEGRPKWGDRFKAMATKHDCEVGVTFCGNPMIAKDLRKQCYLTNKTRTEKQGLFKLHKENF